MGEGLNYIVCENILTLDNFGPILYKNIKSIEYTRRLFRYSNPVHQVEERNADHGPDVVQPLLEDQRQAGRH